MRWLKGAKGIFVGLNESDWVCRRLIGAPGETHENSPLMLVEIPQVSAVAGCC
jgi:hypothetical protein